MRTTLKVLNDGSLHSTLPIFWTSSIVNSKIKTQNFWSGLASRTQVCCAGYDSWGNAQSQGLGTGVCS
jgi:hypothetical protein